MGLAGSKWSEIAFVLFVAIAIMAPTTPVSADDAVYQYAVTVAHRTSYQWERMTEENEPAIQTADSVSRRFRIKMGPHDNCASSISNSAEFRGREY